jgi:hypothetical protein
VLALGLLAVIALGAGGVGTRGNVLWDYDEAIVDADGTFTTTPRDLGGSEVGCLALVVTDIKGGAPKVDCYLSSGTTATIANGTKTGDTFTQITAKGAEMKCANGKEYFQFLWATCGATGTTSTVTVGAYTSGKL